MPMTKSIYVHTSGREFELPDDYAAGLSDFHLKGTPEEEAPAATSRPRKAATKPTSSKEGNK